MGGEVPYFVYVAFDPDEDQGSLKFIRHMLSLDPVPDKVVYKLDDAPWKYLFVLKNHDGVSINHETFKNEREAVVEKDAFFESGYIREHKESEVPKIKVPLFSNRKVVLAAGMAVIIVLFLALKPSSHKELPSVSVVVQRVQPDLSDAEKAKLKMVGSREVSGKIAAVISIVRKNEYARISGMSVQKAESPKAVTYILTTQKEYLYPDEGTVTKAKGIWWKTDTDTVSVGRTNIKKIDTGDFNECLTRMLESGFYVAGRKGACASVTYEGEAARVVSVLTSVSGCSVWLDALTIANGNGRLEATICGDPSSAATGAMACAK